MSGSYSSLIPYQAWLVSGTIYNPHYSPDVEITLGKFVICEYCGIRNPNTEEILYCQACGAPLPFNFPALLQKDDSSTPKLRALIEASIFGE